MRRKIDGNEDIEGHKCSKENMENIKFDKRLLWILEYYDINVCIRIQAT